MRNHFAQCLTELAKENQDIVLLYSDSGNRLFNPFKDVDEDRAINVGIAEANMISVAAGMALNGHYPVTYAITPFTSSRNFEQIKIDIAYQNLPAVIVGTGSGLAYANLGPTHHSFEDIALLRTLPNMQIVSPADSIELQALLPQVIASQRPTYFRIGKKREPNLVPEGVESVLGQPSTFVQGEDVLIIATGPILSVALEVQERMLSENIRCEVVSLHTIKPLNQAYIIGAAKRFNRLVTIEEHGLTGGIGSAVLECLVDNNLHVDVKRFGIPDRFLDKLAAQKNGWQASGLTVDNITKVIREWF